MYWEFDLHGVDLEELVAVLERFTGEKAERNPQLHWEIGPYEVDGNGTVYAGATENPREHIQMLSALFQAGFQLADEEEEAEADHVPGPEELEPWAPGAAECDTVTMTIRTADFAAMLDDLEIAAAILTDGDFETLGNKLLMHRAALQEAAREREPLERRVTDLEERLDALEEGWRNVLAGMGDDGK